MNPLVKTHGKTLMVGTLVVAALWLWMLNILEWLPTGTADNAVRQLRYLLGKTMATMVGDGTAMWMLWFYEVITDGNLFGQITRTPESASRFVGALLLMSGAIWCFS